MNGSNRRRLIPITFAILVAASITIWLARQHRQVYLNRELIAAIKQSDVAKVDVLLAAGADPNTRDTPTIRKPIELRIRELFQRPPPSRWPTVLDEAVLQRRRDNTYSPQTIGIVKSLLTAGANVNAPQWRGRGPLLDYFLLPHYMPVSSDDWHAKNAENKEMLRMLLRSGAHTETPDTIGRTPLQMAINSGATASVRLLLQYGANPNAPRWEGKSCLYLAVESNGWTSAGHVEGEPLESVLAAGAAINEVFSNGQSPLGAAVYYDAENCVQVLLVHGANVNKNTPFGTPISQARRRGLWKIVRILKSHGAKE